MKTTSLPLFLLTLSLAAGISPAATADNPTAERMVALLQSYYGEGAAASKVYVGAETCLACHPRQAGWRQSLHASGLKAVPNDAFSLNAKSGVVADYDNNGVDDFKQGLDLNRISTAFDRYKPNAPILKWDARTGYAIQIGPVTYQIRFAQGSGIYKQRYATKIPVTDRPGGLSAGHYVLPVQYNPPTREYVTWNPGNWYNPDNTPRFTGPVTSSRATAAPSFDKDCTGCHFTGFTVSQDSLGEYVASGSPTVLFMENDPHYYDFNGDGIKEAINTGCERCHGPGGQHVISRGDPKQIVSPSKDLNARQNNELCTSCHTRGFSRPAGIFGYPYDETARQTPADNLGEDVSGRFFREVPGLWPDGKSPRSHRQQGIDYRNTRHAARNVKCYDCHDVHSPENQQIRRHLSVRNAAGHFITVPANYRDNSLCLACHAGNGPFRGITRDDILNVRANDRKIAEVVSAHTFHPYAPARTLGLSRCIDCHMPETAQTTVPYDVASHLFTVVTPDATLSTQAQGGMPNSCTRCHTPMARLFGLPADGSYTTWNEASDVALANWLKTYLGPNGSWWKTR